ncbi:MAG: efflux RND transporter periplasmic adaptor subunit [Nitrospirae bacterium]|nr:efflux RND transporter periplasmic adaptor subunit [Nitrospirota bacterium]
MKKFLFALIAIILIGGCIFYYFYYYSPRKNDAGSKFRTDKVTRGDLLSTVTATGTLNAVVMVNVGAQVSGLIKKLYVDFNSPVKEDQVIALIDPATFQAQVDQSKATLDSAIANLEKAKATLNDTRRTFGREKELFRKDYVARADMDTAETNYLTAVAGVNAAKAQVDQSKAALIQAETNLAYTKIVSPVDGTVVSRNVDVGQTVASSFQTPTLFSIARDLTKMQIDTSIVEADIGKLKVGQPVDFTVDAYQETTFKGIVFQVRQAPIIVQNVVTYDVVVKVDNTDLRLKPGMTANVTILIAKKTGILKIPNAALRFTPFEKKSTTPSPDKGASQRKGPGGGASQRKGPGVWTIENNKPKRVNVQTGISDGIYTELISGKLQEGQDLIVESLVKKSDSGSHGPRMF